MTVRAAPMLFSPYEKPQAYKASRDSCQYFFTVDQRWLAISRCTNFLT